MIIKVNRIDMNSKITYNSVDEYISDQVEAIQPKLYQIRKIIKETVPESTELISYGMPAYKLYHVLVYFAANKNHIGFYPTALPIEFFAKELSDYKTSKGAIQFPVNKELPIELIRKITNFRKQQDELRSSKSNKKVD